jgi:hypothetical protein
MSSNATLILRNPIMFNVQSKCFSYFAFFTFPSFLNCDIFTLFRWINIYYLNFMFLYVRLARTIPTERPLVDEVSANFLRIEGATWSASRIPTALFSAF